MLALLVAAALSAAPESAFAFVDATGKRLLAVGAVEQPARLTRATCDGKLVEVTYLREQPRGAKDTGRLVSFNFDQSPGSLYELQGAAAERDATCLLGTPSFFAVRAPVPVTASKQPCAKPLADAAAALGKRAVQACTEVGRFPGGTLAHVAFASDGEQLLVGLALDAGATTALRAFPAKRDPGGFSCWRADDGCAFPPHSYRVPLVLKRKDGLELLGLWDGPEGQVAERLSVSGQALAVADVASRYWSPP